MKLAVILGSLVVITLAACGGEAKTAAPLAASTAARVAKTTARVTPEKLSNAVAIMAALKAANLPIGAVTTYTATTDPNHLLGRPNGYVAKLAWSDTSISASD